VFSVRRYLFYIALTVVLGVTPISAEANQAEFDAQVKGILAKLNAEAAAPEGASILGALIQREYETPTAELQWALNRGMPWGSIAALAYIRATKGESFAVLESKTADLWVYVENAGMNADKLAGSLGQLLKRVKEERNTRIFEQVRLSRKVTRMPDLGSGFGLLQETLDFRRLEPPRPTKIHTTNP
jgi:hypothetical protein